jgi:hypothetical protein
MSIITVRNIALPPFFLTLFAKYNDYLTDMPNKIAHVGSVYENFVRLDKHPLVEVYMPG